MNFLRRLALQEKKLDDSARPRPASELVSFLVRLRTYLLSNFLVLRYMLGYLVLWQKKLNIQCAMAQVISCCH